MLKSSIQTELILKDEVRHLLDDLAALMKLRAVFFSADGREIERGRDAGCSDYCRAMQQNRFGLQACLDLDAAKRRECMTSGRIKSYICHAGLGEIIAPVMLLDKVAGFIVIGQFRVFASSPGFALSDEEKDAYLRLPLLDKESINNLIHMVQVLLDYIVDKELVAFPHDLRMLKLLRYVEKNLDRSISLSEAAKASGCSESTLTHYLKQHNTSFSSLVTEKRINRAKELLRRSPEMTLKEISEASGFNSVGYFSRVFKAFCNMTPGSCRGTYAQNNRITQKNDRLN